MIDQWIVEYHLIRHERAHGLSHVRDPLLLSGRPQHHPQEPRGGGDLAKVLQQDGVPEADEQGHGAGHEGDGGDLGKDFGSHVG